MSYFPVYEKDKALNNVLVRDHTVTRQLTATDVKIMNLLVENVTISNLELSDPAVDNLLDLVLEFLDQNELPRLTVSDLTVTGSLTMVPPATINLTTLTRNGTTYNWPTTDGPPGSVLTTNGTGTLEFQVPVGGGNVTADPVFSSNHVIPRTNTSMSNTTVEQTGLMITDTNDLQVPGQVSSAQFNGPLVGNVTGNATSATTTANFTNPLAGEVSGPQTSTVVNNVGSVSAAQIQSGVTTANTATATNVNNSVVFRNGSGGFSAGPITSTQFTGPLNGNATSATTAGSFSGNLAGEVTGPQSATLVNNIGTVNRAQIQSGVTAANAATSANTSSMIVLRDGSGGFFAGPVTSTQFTGPLTGNVTGNATSATTAGSATSFTGTLAGDVSGTQTTTHVDTVGGQNYITIGTNVQKVTDATSTTLNNNLVIRNSSGGFSGSTITADTNFVGNLVGNASTATSATTAASATNFSGSLSGDVTGNQTTTKVAQVQNDAKTQTVSNNQIVTGIQLTQTATSNSVANSLVQRDASGNFVANDVTTNSVTINGPVVNPTDAATREYVDSAVAGGVVQPKQSVVALAATSITLSGVPQTIDGVVVVAGNRVLVVNQGNDGNLANVDNGIWVANAGAWTRPADFNTGDTAGTALVLVDVPVVPNTYGGSSWLCNTPTAVIGTDPIGFGQFSAPNAITGANVGTGQGVFLNKTSNTLNFKSLDPGTVTSTHLTIVNGGNQLAFSTDGTSSNTANTLVARDSSGNFSASTITGSLTGAASLNVLKAGDSMTGTLVMTNQNEIRFQDSGSNYVGWKGPNAVSSSYTLNWPITAPTGAGQVLLSTSATDTAWATPGGAVVLAPRFIFVTKGGNDTTGNGTVVAPFLTVSKAVTMAIAAPVSLSQPIVISVGPGIYDENPMVIPSTSPGLSIVGSSLTGTTIRPVNLASPLFSFGTPFFEIATVTLDTNNLAGSISSAIAISTTTFGNGGLRTVFIRNFQLGINASTSSVIPPILILAQFQLTLNTTGIFSSGTRLIMENCLCLGSIVGTPTGTAIQITSAASLCTITSSTFRNFNVALSLLSATASRVVGCVFDNNFMDLSATLSSDSDVVGCSFISNPDNTAIDIQVKDPGTEVRVTGCSFEGNGSVATGTCIQSIQSGDLDVSACIISRCANALVCGQAGDTIATKIIASNVTLEECTNDIVQTGTSKMVFVGGQFDRGKVSIADSTNCYNAAFDVTSSGTLSLGKTADTTQNVYQILNATTDPFPSMVYEPNYYSLRGTIYKEPIASTNTITGMQSLSGNAYNYTITGDNTKACGLRLISDTSTFGNGDNVRGWLLSKLGTSGNLAFNYVNADTSGQAAFGDNTYCYLDGPANTFNFPQTTVAPLPSNVYTKLVWGPEVDNVNLYRFSSGTLKTDSNFVINQALTVSSLTPSRAVVTDGSSALASSATTATEIGFVSGVTSNIQTQLNSKFPSGGGTLTGNLTLPVGSAAAPSLNFTGFTNTGLSTSAGALQLSTNGTAQLSINATTGVLTAASLNTGTAGVVHANASGAMSNSLIVNADITDGTIADTKLQTLTTAGKVANSATTATSSSVANTIVSRDASNNFSANIITASLNGNAATATTATTATTAGSATNFTGPLTGDVTGTQSATVVSTVGGLSAATVATGVTAANNATASATPSTIVLRNGSNTFATGGIQVTGLTASRAVVTDGTSNLASSATTATEIGFVNGVTSNIQTQLNSKFPSGGGTITGNLTLPVGSAASPSLNFTGFTTTGLSTNAGNLQLSTNGTSQLSIATTGEITATNLATGTAGVVHSSTVGLLSNSLIVGADITDGTIPDTKLQPITTAGKVSNSATTATANNTGNTIVLRDATGAFAAGNIFTRGVPVRNTTLTTLTVSTTLSAAQILGGLITMNNGGATTLTYPTATALVTALPGLQVGDTLQVQFFSIGNGNVSFVAGSGLSFARTPIVLSNTAPGQLHQIRFTNIASPTAVIYWT